MGLFDSIASGAGKLLGAANPLGAAAALAGVGFGIYQGVKAKREERNNVMPMTSVNSNILKNVGLAEQRARVGLPQRVYNNQLNQLNTGLNTGVRAASRMGGLQNINSTLRAYNGGIDNLDARDAQAQQQGEQGLMQQRGILANEEQRVFDWNKAQPYMRMSQRIASLRNASTQNIFGGIGLLSSVNKPTSDSSGDSETDTNYPIGNYMKPRGFSGQLGR